MLGAASCLLAATRLQTGPPSLASRGRIPPGPDPAGELALSHPNQTQRAGWTLLTGKMTGTFWEFSFLR
ncbi:hypothetical protein D623_10007850 [Myotis brandtii]|uniref:Uncharacterized protein n=1 Tax=Myotis brandtii TaxID=109478 RepID=S7N2E3_MYOBR|nr:hypothetical protein D623_10007850 [Myotis brandtii]